jgi:hypothetical protein
LRKKKIAFLGFFLATQKIRKRGEEKVKKEKKFSSSSVWKSKIP